MTDSDKQDLNETTPELEKEIAEALGDMSVMDLVEQPKLTEPNPVAHAGDHAMAKGKVVAVHDDDVFIDLGGKSQGIVPLSQFDKAPELGAELEFVVEGVLGDEGLVKLSRQGAVEKATWQSLERGMVVEARVTGSNTGGLELKIAGQRAFMPASQIDLHRVENLNEFLNQKLKCQVIELDRRGKKIVLSRRAVMETERAAEREKVLENIKPGDLMDGVVSSIKDYGAFVDLGGVDGMVHVSDLAYQRVSKVEQVVKVGDKVRVKVLSIEADKQRIALSLKDALPNPWENLGDRYPVGGQVTGEVVKLASFGAFIEVEPGVEGLVPMSELSWGRVASAGAVLKKGDRINAKVLSVEPERQRMSLSIKQLGEDPWHAVDATYPPESTVTGTVTRTTDFGAFVELEPGIEGMVHISELSNKRVASVEDAVKVGQEVQAMVLAVDSGKRRIGLSLKALMAPEPGQERRGPRGRSDKASRDDIRKYSVKDTRKASTGENLGALLDKFGGDDSDLKGGIG